MKYWLQITLVLFAIWAILSGQLNFKFLAIGLISSGIVARICLPLFFEERSNKFVLSLNYFRLLTYFFWLLYQIFIATLSVVSIILLKGNTTTATIMKFKCHYENPMAKAFLISSIILTPGTVTIDITNGDTYHVHAISKGAAEGMASGEMQKRIGNLFGEVVLVEMSKEVPYDNVD
ncbi:MAG: Na+/H+ antiporter subunit E [Anaerovoracaceae bacterium]